MAASLCALNSNTISVDTQEPFSNIGPDVGLHILSYLGYADLSRFATVSKGAKQLRDKNNFQLERVLFSKIVIFDRKHWKDYWNVEITNQYDAGKIDIKILRKFLGAYYGPNPIGPGRVCDHCLIPTVVPSQIGYSNSKNIVYEKFCLSALENVVEHPLRGYPAKYSDSQSEALERYGNIPFGPDKLVIKIKGIVARSQSWEKQVQSLAELFVKTEWGCVPDALSQNTVILAHHAMTGELPHGDETGMEGCVTYGRTDNLLGYEEDVYPISSGGFRKIVPGGDSAMAELDVGSVSVFDSESDGVGVQRTF